MVDKTLKKFIYQIDVELADARAYKLDIKFQSGTPREIHHHARQCLVQRHISMTITAQTLLVPDSLGERLSKGDADIFYRMMGIDMQISFGDDLQVYHAVTRHLIQHVVEKWHTRVQHCLAGAIQINFDAIWVSRVLRLTWA